VSVNGAVLPRRVGHPPAWLKKSEKKEEIEARRSPARQLLSTIEPALSRALVRPYGPSVTGVIAFKEALVWRVTAARPTVASPACSQRNRVHPENRTLLV
jgi:hypothetical protein